MTDCPGQSVTDFSPATRKNHPRPLSHTNDPETSYEAADKMVESGTLSRQEKKVHKAIVKFFSIPRREFTARTLAFCSNIDYFIIQRRLSGLYNKGKIERIKIGKKQMGATEIYKPIYKKRDGCCVWRIVL